MASKWVLHFSSPMYLSFESNNLNRVDIKVLHPNIEENGVSPSEECGHTFYAKVAI